MKNKRLRFLTLALTATMALGACSSDQAEQANDLPTLAAATDDGATDSNPGEPTDEGNGEVTEADQERAFAEYEACMADAGIDIGDVTGDGEGAAIESLDAPEESADEPFDPEAFEEAIKVCDEILEATFGSFELSPEQAAEEADQLLEMQRCLGEQGFDIDMSGNSFQLDESIDFEAFEAAMSECGEGLEIGGDQ